jgi:hypothetical protein
MPPAYLLHATLLAGGLPILGGDSALELLEAYANVVAGGRLLLLPVPAATIEPGDLLGRVGADGTRVVGSGGLLDAIRFARKTPESLALVVLDGCTRAPLEGYLLPLLDAALPNAEGRTTQRPLSPVLDPVLCPDETDREALGGSWPENLLLAATIVPGPTTLPPGRSVWRVGTLILTERALQGSAEPAEPNTLQPVAPLASCQVAASIWQGWRNASVGPHPGAEAYRVLRQQAARLLGGDSDRLGERIAAVLSDYADVLSGLRWLATARCCPRLAGNAEALNELEEIFASAYPPVESVPPLAGVIPWLA